MMRKIDFGNHEHRCLFWNDCVQAHLLGLRSGCQCFEACFQQKATVLITFGEARAHMGGQDRCLKEGDQMEVPQSMPLRLFTASEADVMLVLKP